MNKNLLTIWFALLISASLYYYFSRYAYAPDAGLNTLEFQSQDGELMNLDHFAGSPLVVHFYAYWCGPCMREMPQLNEAALTLAGEGVATIGLSDDPMVKIKEIHERFKLNFPNFKLSGSLRNNGVPSIPTTFILNAEHEVCFSFSGGKDWSDPKLIEEIKIALEKSI